MKFVAIIVSDHNSLLERDFLLIITGSVFTEKGVLKTGSSLEMLNATDWQIVVAQCFGFGVRLISKADN